MPPNYNNDLTPGGYFVKGSSQALTRGSSQPIHVKVENSKARFEYKGPEDSRQSDKAMAISALMVLKK
jgi:hypothetical protein